MIMDGGVDEEYQDIISVFNVYSSTGSDSTSDADDLPNVKFSESERGLPSLKSSNGESLSRYKEDRKRVVEWRTRWENCRRRLDMYYANSSDDTHVDGRFPVLNERQKTPTHPLETSSSKIESSRDYMSSDNAACASECHRCKRRRGRIWRFIYSIFHWRRSSKNKEAQGCFETSIERVKSPTKDTFRDGSPRVYSLGKAQAQQVIQRQREEQKRHNDTVRGYRELVLSPYPCIEPYTYI